MPWQEIWTALHTRPFEPFRLLMSDGTTYEVRHPELVMLGMRSLHLGIPARNQEELLYERAHILALSHITRLEPVDAARRAES